MYFVYLLLSETHQKTYVGYTSDLNARLTAHNHESNKGYTKRYAPWVCIYNEPWPEKQDAMVKEKWLKSGSGRKWIKEYLANRGIHITP